jgi:hypothetical protein
MKSGRRLPLALAAGWFGLGAYALAQAPDVGRRLAPFLDRPGFEELTRGKSPAGQHVATADAEIVQGLQDGQAQDVLILLDDVVGLPSFSGARSTTSARSDQAAIDARVAALSRLKASVLGPLDSHLVEVLRDYSHLPIVFAHLRSSAALQEVVTAPGVKGVFVNRLLHADGGPNLAQIGQPAVAAAGYVGGGATVAVLDGPVDYANPAFGSCSAPGVPAGCIVVQALKFGSGGSTASGQHATNVAGIVHDVAPGAKIVSVDVFSGDIANGSDMIAGLNWCLANGQASGIVAVNMSIVGSSFTEPCYSDPIETAINSLLQAGILTSVSAGNDGYADRLAYPACAPSALSVGAVWDANWGPQTINDPPHPVCTDNATFADEITCFSQSASFLALLAPGAWINSAGLTYEGTSQASPHVAGSIAVLRAGFPSDQIAITIADLVQVGTQILDSRNGLSKPRLNLQAAVFGPYPQCSSAGATFPLSVSTQLLSSAGCFGVDSSERIYYAQGYSFTGTAGQVLTADMSSASLDTFQYLVSPSSTTAATASSNPGVSRNSHLSFTLDATGTWTLYASSFWPQSGGPFLLTANLGSLAGPCVPNSTTLCIDDQPGDKRFKLQVAWATSQNGGQAGNGQAISLSSVGVAQGGLFWFFSGSNPEMLVKVLGACGVNGHHWVFGSAGTNVGLTFTVTDTATGAQKVYSNPDLQPAVPIQDLNAFTCP